MEMTKLEITAVKDIAADKEAVVTELDSLELALVGGGMGDIVLHCR